MTQKDFEDFIEKTYPGEYTFIKYQRFIQPNFPVINTPSGRLANDIIFAVEAQDLINFDPLTDNLFDLADYVLEGDKVVFDTDDLFLNYPNNSAIGNILISGVSNPSNNGTFTVPNTGYYNHLGGIIPNFIPPPSHWLNPFIGIDPSELSPPKLEPAKTACECGSDKIGSPRHSSWCPKYS